MSTMERILRLMVDKKASDVYLSAHSPALIKINGQAIPINAQILPADAPRNLLAEVIGIGEPPEGDDNDRPLLVPLVEDGERVYDETLETARDRLRDSLAELPLRARQLSRGEAAIPTVFEDVTSGGAR